MKPQSPLLFFRRAPVLLALAVGSAAMADFLFYDHPVGWTFGLFILILAAVVLARRPEALGTRAGRLALAACAGLALALAEEPGPLDRLLALVLVWLLAVIGCGQWPASARKLILMAENTLHRALTRPFQDLNLWVRRLRRRGVDLTGVRRAFRLWVLPVGLSLVFVMLFAAANPIIEDWVGRARDTVWDLMSHLPELPPAERVFLWAVVGLFVWALIRGRIAPKWRHWIPEAVRTFGAGSFTPSMPTPIHRVAAPPPLPGAPLPADALKALARRAAMTRVAAARHVAPASCPEANDSDDADAVATDAEPVAEASNDTREVASEPPNAAAPPAPPSVAGVFNTDIRKLRPSPEVIVRCLAAFNVVFAVQTLLDLLFLYGGAALPKGMTYAGYAHRGAYPLVATALLAAIFTLWTFGSESDSRAGVWARRLVFAWLAQNVLLVASSFWRLHLYVEIYSLTRLRIAAAIWMGLVAMGLIWIAARIAARRSNVWLVRMNVITAAAVLYATCFINFDGFIASYNVAHCREVAGEGSDLDLDYLLELGYEALPALRDYEARFPAGPAKEKADQVDAELVRLLNEATSDWRGWTIRRSGLLRATMAPKISRAVGPK